MALPDSMSHVGEVTTHCSPYISCKCREEVTNRKLPAVPEIAPVPPGQILS